MSVKQDIDTAQKSKQEAIKNVLSCVQQESILKRETDSVLIVALGPMGLVTQPLLLVMGCA